MIGLVSGLLFMLLGYACCNLFVRFFSSCIVFISSSQSYLTFLSLEDFQAIFITSFPLESDIRSLADLLNVTDFVKKYTENVFIAN